MEERARGMAGVVGVSEGLYEARGQGERRAGGHEAGGEEVGVELQEATGRRRVAGGEDGQEGAKGRRRHSSREKRSNPICNIRRLRRSPRRELVGPDAP